LVTLLRYEGNWSSDKMEGPGTVFFRNGTSEEVIV
jgi:hypothetical protein